MRFTAALVLSLVAHGILAVALAWYLWKRPQPQTLVTLDLSSVQLSFAEKVVENERRVDSVANFAEMRPREEKKVEEKKVEKRKEVKREVKREEKKVEKRKEVKSEVKREEKKVEKRKEVKREEKKVVPPSVSKASPAPRQAKIDAPPRPRRTIRPDYPRAARLRGEQGSVVVELTVAADGSVSEAHVVTSCGYADLDESALKAVLAARFKPAKSGGKNVSSSARLSLQFRLK